MGVGVTGESFESGRDSLRCRSVSVVAVDSRDEARLTPDATLRAVEPRGVYRGAAVSVVFVRAIFLLRMLARREGAVLILSLSVASSTLLRTGRSPVRVNGARVGAVDGVRRSSAGTSISANK